MSNSQSVDKISDTLQSFLHMMKKYVMNAFLWYIRSLAKLQLKKHTPLIIGVTGSAGKTSSLNAIEAVLKALPEKKLRVTHKANSEVGLPLHILGITVWDFRIKTWIKITLLAFWKLLTNWEKTDIYVAEMGIDSPFPPKNMEYLLSFLKPDIGVFLNARSVHSEAFDPVVSEKNLELRTQALIHAIATEKGKLISQLPTTGTAILNSDDSEVAAFSSQTKASVVSFGTDSGTTIQLLSWKPSLKGTQFSFRIEGKEHTLNFSQFLLPEHYGHSLATGLAVAIALQIPLEKAIASLEKNLTLPPGRSSLIEGLNGSFILDSSYNASLQPMIDMLNLVKKIQPKRAIAVLGDMREMGTETEHAHKEVAQKAEEMADLIVLVGPLMEQYVLPFVSKTKSHWFPNALQASQFLTSQIQAGDCVLVKGSQNTILLETVVEKLMAHPEQAEKLLCRRGSYWEAKRKKISN